MSAIICGGGCLERICCKSNIVVCIPRVLRIMAVMAGWVYMGRFWESCVDKGDWEVLGWVGLVELGCESLSV